MAPYLVETLSRIDAVAPAAWNGLSAHAFPFLRHEFLAALERQGCLGEAYGWLPRHLLLKGAGGEILAAAPCYLKFNSYGELVFDWSWADAYRRAGVAYYPKLVVASPYTPANGPRILTSDAGRRPEYAHALVRGAVEVADRLGVSSLHWLFVTGEESDWLEGQGLMRRIGCQFHWRNQGYEDFEGFLATLTSEKRKKIRRERRRVAEAGIRHRVLRGDEVGEAEWATFHRLYRSTFDRRGGIPTLSLGFFQEIAATMGDQVLLVLAQAGPRVVAAALDLVGRDTLYGRHWGCFEDYHSLHFETCYYQGLEFCIREGLERFEPGAQGEHKLSRGFLPTATYSNHWIADPRFRAAIGRHLALETEGMRDYLGELHDHSPYRSDPGGPSPA
jgi:predicted N-acyltransferase